MNLFVLKVRRKRNCGVCMGHVCENFSAPLSQGVFQRSKVLDVPAQHCLHIYVHVCVICSISICFFNLRFSFSTQITLKCTFEAFYDQKNIFLPGLRSLLRTGDIKFFYMSPYHTEAIHGNSENTPDS